MDATRALQREHRKRERGLGRVRRRRLLHEPAWHPGRASWVCRACGSFCKDRFAKRTKQACVRKKDIWKEAQPSHALSKSEEIGAIIPMVLCRKCFCYSSSKAVGLPRRRREKRSYAGVVRAASAKGLRPATRGQPLLLWEFDLGRTFGMR